VPRFLALGDSYTIGEGVTDAERWPNHLARMLRARGFEIDDPHIIARTAWTTDELQDAIDAEKPRGPFDLVTLLIGVNDQYRSRPVKSFEPEFRALVKRAVGFAGGKPRRVIGVSIPDWGATPFAKGRDGALIAGEIGAYNDRAAELVKNAGGAWVDVTELSRAMLVDSTLVAVDGLHPTGAMYERWASAVLPAAEHALSASSRRPSSP
jgi:lysophospholipase L1-like esterase